VAQPWHHATQPDHQQNNKRNALQGQLRRLGPFSAQRSPADDCRHSTLGGVTYTLLGRVTQTPHHALRRTCVQHSAFQGRIKCIRHTNNHTTNQPPIGSKGHKVTVAQHRRSV
jgi:hypothetical protein